MTNPPDSPPGPAGLTARLSDLDRLAEIERRLARSEAFDRRGAGTVILAAADARWLVELGRRLLELRARRRRSSIRDEVPGAAADGRPGSGPGRVR